MVNLTSDNKQLAKNTSYMYIRMAVSLAIGLYTSRAILSALGAEDYGINNIVGGVVGMLSLFTSSLSSAATRFLTYELGKNDVNKLKDTFTTITLLLILLSGIVFLLGETLGLWLLKKYIVIPALRWDAALFCYHCSLIIFIVNLISLPYQSLVTAHEHFNFYAFADITNSILKLVIVWLIYLSSYDRLITYSTLLVAVSIILRVAYGLYCSKHFKESKLNFCIDLSIFRDIAVYCGWVTIGSSSSILKEQGINVLLNMFFGVLINAARGISMQVFSIVGQFANSISSAIQPQITKSFAAGDIQRSIHLTFILTKAKGMMIVLIALPIAIEADYILKLWLGNVPEHTVLFVQWALITCYARALEDSHTPLFLATGRVRNLQIVGGGLMLMNLPVSYIFLKMGYPAIVTMQIGVLIELTVMLVCFIFLRHMIGFPLLKFYTEAVIPQVLVIILTACLPLLVLRFLDEGIGRLFFNTTITMTTVTILGYALVLNKSEKSKVMSYVNKKILKK